jgi:hypothetical protein
MAQIVRLSSGTVTQNGSWISYKTTIYSKQISFYQQLADELSLFLIEQDISYSRGFEAEHCFDSQTRKDCVTVKCFSVDEKINLLPYDADSIN